MLRVRDLSLSGDKKIRRTLLGGSFVLLLFLFGIVEVTSPLTPTVVEAQVNNLNNLELEGFAWSDNIGWISFNCKDVNVCGDFNYKVFYNPNNGVLSGFAWSDGIGWVKFGGLSDFPASGGNALIDESGSVQGWARACGGTLNGNCSTMEDHPDGWDGWISISGPGYGPTLNDDDELVGFSWGDDVVGWIDWNPFSDDSGPGGSSGFGGVGISTPFQFDFVQPLQLVISPGESGLRMLEINRTSGSSDDVTFTHGSVAQGITINSITPETCQPDCTSTISISVGVGVPSGTYPLQITATSQSQAAISRTLNIVVPALEGVTCYADANSATIDDDVVWTAEVAVPGNYTYEWSGGASGDTASVTEQYQNIGTKEARVRVTDTDTAASAECVADILITNKKNFKEF